MKKVVILGSTGSIGQSALRVVEALPDRLKIVGLASRGNVRSVLRQAARFGVKNVCIADPRAAAGCSRAAAGNLRIFKGEEGLAEIASLGEADIVLCAVVGMAGLAPVLAALKNGADVALATKEVLVAAGRIVMETARRHNVRVIPVDSEHSAVFQCLEACRGKAEAKTIILTASGGPFHNRPRVNFDKVTVAEALNHPKWHMGRKVSVDSATLMNKGLEVIEAHWLFGMPMKAIEVVVHPESIVHSAVEFVDGGVLAQLSVPDMRFAIQYALTYPERVDGHLPRLDLARRGFLRFHEPDYDRFPCLRLARDAGEKGGSAPAVLNAANEVAVEKFLGGRIAFSGIWHTVGNVLRKHRATADPSLEEIVAADAWARAAASAAPERKR